MSRRATDLRWGNLAEERSSEKELDRQLSKAAETAAANAGEDVKRVLLEHIENAKLTENA